MTAPAVIEATALTKEYAGRTAVDHVDLTVRRGTIFGLLGPNGAGKTTTILMLLGLTEPTSGSARVLGLDPTRDSLEIKRHVGYLPDDVGFYPELTARDNLRYTAALNRIPRRTADGVVDALLAEVGLEHAADRKVGGFSRGMRQRLGLADALVKTPDIIILDEPTVNIDPVGVTEITALVRRLRDERDMTVLLSSHLLHQVQETCDEVAMFVGGRMVAQGTVEDLAADGRDVGIRLETRGGSSDRVHAVLRDALAHVPGSSWTDQGEGRFELRAPTDVRARVVRALVDADIALVGVELERRSLEDVYARRFASEVAS
jgi:ABC-2 type transport system ATP-binding protein